MNNTDYIPFFIDAVTVAHEIVSTVASLIDKIEMPRPNYKEFSISFMDKGKEVPGIYDWRVMRLSEEKIYDLYKSASNAVRNEFIDDLDVMLKNYKQKLRVVENQEPESNDIISVFVNDYGALIQKNPNALLEQVVIDVMATLGRKINYRGGLHQEALCEETINAEEYARELREEYGFSAYVEGEEPDEDDERDESDVDDSHEEVDGDPIASQTLYVGKFSDKERARMKNRTDLLAGLDGDLFVAADSGPVGRPAFLERAEMARDARTSFGNIAALNCSCLIAQALVALDRWRRIEIVEVEMATWRAAFEARSGENNDTPVWATYYRAGLLGEYQQACKQAGISYTVLPANLFPTAVQPEEPMAKGKVSGPHLTQG